MAWDRALSTFRTQASNFFLRGLRSECLRAADQLKYPASFFFSKGHRHSSSNAQRCRNWKRDARSTLLLQRPASKPHCLRNHLPSQDSVSWAPRLPGKRRNRGRALKKPFASSNLRCDKSSSSLEGPAVGMQLVSC